MLKSLILPSLLLLSGPVALAQNLTCGFTLISSQTNSSGTTRTDSITYAFEGTNVAMIIHDQHGQPDVPMVFDAGAKTITQLFEMNRRKGGFVFPMTEKRWPGMAYATHTSGTDESVRYTGKTKTIEGHVCKQAMASNAKYTATVWVAEDIPLSMLRVFSYQSVGAGKSTEEADLLAEMSMKGFPMEMHLKSLTDKPDVHLRITDFQEHVDPTMFSTEGYSTTWVEE